MVSAVPVTGPISRDGRLTTVIPGAPPASGVEPMQGGGAPPSGRPLLLAASATLELSRAASASTGRTPAASARPWPKLPAPTSCAPPRLAPEQEHAATT